MFISIGRQSGESVESVIKKEKSTVRRIYRKKGLSLEWKSEGVTDDESGESIEPIGEMPLLGLGDSEFEILVRGWRREDGSWFHRRGKAMPFWQSTVLPSFKVRHCLENHHLLGDLNWVTSVPKFSDKDPSQTNPANPSLLTAYQDFAFDPTG